MRHYASQPCSATRLASADQPLRRQMRDRDSQPGVFTSTGLPAATDLSSCKSPTPLPSDTSVAVVMPFYCQSSAQLADLQHTWEALKNQTSVSIDNFFLVDDAGPIPAPDLDTGGAVQQARSICTGSMPDALHGFWHLFMVHGDRCKSFGSLQILVQQQQETRVFMPQRQQAMTLSVSWMMTAHHRLTGCIRWSVPRSSLLALWGVSPAQHSPIP